MAIPYVLEHGLQNAPSWRPNKRWKSSQVMFFSVMEVSGQTIVARAIDPSFPIGLGMDKRCRFPNFLDHILMIHECGLQLSPGKTYVMIGYHQPILRDNVWDITLSKSSRLTPVMRVLDWATVPSGVLREDSHDVRTPSVPCQASSGAGTGPPALRAQDGIPGVDDCQWGASMLLTQSHSNCRQSATHSQQAVHGLEAGPPALRAQDGIPGVDDCQWGASFPCHLDGHNGASNQCDDARLSGFYDLNGRFHVCSTPTQPETVQSWISRWAVLPWEHVWFSWNGRHVGLNTMLDAFQAVLLRVRAKLYGGGAKTAGFNAADTDKLRKHLLTKGVPEVSVDSRMTAILDILAPAQLADIYRSLEPWANLKAAVKQRVRLVTPEELKQHKSSAKPASSSTQKQEHDPWLESDPWQEGRLTAAAHATTHAAQAQATISLLPEYFCNEDGTHPEIIQPVGNGSAGVWLATVEEVETLTVFGAAVSADECAAVVLGTTQPNVGSFSCEAITFVAQHSEAGRVLLKGFLVNLGDKTTSVQPDDDIINVSPKDTQVITLEVAAQYCREWPQIRGNPLRFAYKTIEGLQSAVTSTWSRKFFQDKVACGSDVATSYHAFAKVLAPELSKLLRLSGIGGVFLTPKNESENGPSPQFRVIWAEGNDLEKALVAARANPAICGVVRGRGNLGWRVCVKDYVRVRATLGMMLRPL